MLTVVRSCEDYPMNERNSSNPQPTRILYLFPDRSSITARNWEQETFWPTYRAAALEVGLDFDVADPEHIIVTDERALWNGKDLDPSSSELTLADRLVC